MAVKQRETPWKPQKCVGMSQFSGLGVPVSVTRRIPGVTGNRQALFPKKNWDPNRPESTVNWDPNLGLSVTISVRYNQFGDPLRRADDRVVSTASISKPANAERTSGGSLMLSKKRPLSPASCWAIRPNCVRSNRGAPASDAWFGVGRMRDFGDAIDDPFGKVALAADIGRDRPCRTHRREGFGCIFRPRPVPFHSLFVPASRSREAGRPR